MTTTAVVHKNVHHNGENHREGEVCDNESCKEAITSNRKIISFGNDLLIMDFGFGDAYEGETNYYNFRYEYIVKE